MQSPKQKLSKAVFEKALTFMVAAFGFVAALAWNDAIQSLFREIFGSVGGGSIAAKFIYAILITAVATIISFRLGRDIGPKS